MDLNARVSVSVWTSGGRLLRWAVISQRDEAANPVRGRGGVDAGQDKVAGVGAGVCSFSRRGW